jgi:hypothetical protein
MTIPSTASSHYGTYIRKGDLTAILRIKLTDVLYALWIRQWFSILHSQADTSRATDLGHLKGALPAGGELVSTVLSEHPSEHWIVHLEFSAMHKLLLAAFERMVVPCIFIADCHLLSSTRSISSHRS